MLHISDSSFLVVQTKLHKNPCTKSLNCSGRFLSGRFCPGWFWFVPLLLLSEYILYHIKFNITFHFRFHMYDKKIKSVTSHMLFTPPSSLSQTVTPSLTPSSLERDVLYIRPLYCNALLSLFSSFHLSSI